MSRGLGQPAGIWVLFLAEMWERFSYYGMRALLVLYLITSTDGGAHRNPGFGWSEEAAYLLYGVYTWAVYLTPIVGGLLAQPFPATWYQAVNPAAVIVFAPLFAWLWPALGRRVFDHGDLATAETLDAWGALSQGAVIPVPPPSSPRMRGSPELGTGEVMTERHQGREIPVATGMTIK
jgi:dipeptide/tripeptide permease